MYENPGGARPPWPPLPTPMPVTTMQSNWYYYYLCSVSLNLSLSLQRFCWYAFCQAGLPWRIAVSLVLTFSF